MDFSLSVWKNKKSRIVFESKVRVSEDRSLNEELISGPDRNNYLRGVLLQFRKHPHAVTADVENMFHHIAIPDEQRTYMRFFGSKIMIQMRRWWTTGPKCT